MTDKNHISQPPTRLQQVSDIMFRRVCSVSAWLSVLLVAFIVLKISATAAPAIKQYGLKFLTGTTWDPQTGEYGILPEIWGTLFTSLLALIAGSFFGVAAAIFLSEKFLGQFIFGILKIFKMENHPVWSKFPDRSYCFPLLVLITKRHHK